MVPGPYSLDVAHTADNIRERVVDVLKEYGAEEKVVCSATDNASNEKDIRKKVC